MADGVGGWADNGVDPSLFSQCLMYHAHLRSEVSWAGEPETDPTQPGTESEAVEGYELSPISCLDEAFDGVMLDPSVRAGEYHRWFCLLIWVLIMSIQDPVQVA